MPYDCKKMIVHCLGTNQARPKRMNFRKTSKGGWGVIFITKICVADFGPFYRAFSDVFRKKFATYISEYERGWQGPFGIFPRIKPFW